MSEQRVLDWPDCFERLLPEIRAAIGRQCAYRGAAASGDDIEQDLVLRLWEGRHRLKFDSRAALFGYVLKTVREEIPHASRRGTKGGRVQFLEPATLAELAPAVEAGSGASPSIDELLALLANEQQRRACQLRYGEGLKFEEVAKRLGVSLGTAHARVRQAIEVLRIKLADKSAVSGADA